MAVQQPFERLKTTVPSAARELNRTTLPIIAEIPNNPRSASGILLDLHRRQNERGQSVSEDYARGVQIFESLFVRYRHQELADSLPELPQGSATGDAIPTNQMQLHWAAHSHRPLK